jgi:hypothetical protein
MEPEKKKAPVRNIQIKVKLDTNIVSLGGLHLEYLLLAQTPVVRFQKPL